VEGSINVYTVNVKNKIKRIHKLQSSKTDAAEIRKIYKDALVHPRGMVYLPQEIFVDSNSHDSEVRKHDTAVVSGPVHKQDTNPDKKIIKKWKAKSHPEHKHKKWKRDMHIPNSQHYNNDWFLRKYKTTKESLKVLGAITKEHNPKKDTILDNRKKERIVKPILSYNNELPDIPFHGISVAEPNKKVSIMQDDESEYGEVFEVDTMIQGNTQSFVGHFGWNLDRIDQRGLPLDQLYKTIINASSGPTDVHVYVVDTGVDNEHVAFTNVQISMDYPTSLGAKDCNGHGTHVASTVAGIFSGVMLNTPLESPSDKGKIVIHAVKVLGCDGSGTTFDVISGLLWIYDNVQYPAVITMSLGSSRSFNFDDVVSLIMQDKKIPIIAAAGNDGGDACLVSPAGVAGVTAVGSTSISDYISSFSNRGTCVDVFAPGEDVAGAYFGDSVSYFTLSGTSMATPHVTSTVAAFSLLHYGSYTQQNLANGALSKTLANATVDAVKGSLLGATNKLIYIGQNTMTTDVPPSELSSSGYIHKIHITVILLAWLPRLIL